MQGMIKTLSQGFGAHVNRQRNEEVNQSMASGLASVRSSVEEDSDAAYHSERIKELEAEIADLREIIKQGASDKDLVAKFINQLKQKDLLLAKKSDKLDEISKRTGINKNETMQLDNELKSMGTGRYS